MTSNAHDHTRTTLRVDNIHCSSCVASIADIVAGHSPFEDQKNSIPSITDVDISLQERTVSFTHTKGFDLRTILIQLDASGFDVWLPPNTVATLPRKLAGLSNWRSFLKAPFAHRDVKSSQRQQTHREICSACRASESSSNDNVATLDGNEKRALQESRFVIEGMTYRCVGYSKRFPYSDPQFINSSCTSAISTLLSPSSEPGIHSCQVTLQPPSALVVHDVSILSVNHIKELIENAGYGAELVASKNTSAVAASGSQQGAETYKAKFSILGMTCASCVSSVTRAMDSVPGTSMVSVDLIGNTGSVVVQRKEDVELVRSEIEDVGFECSVVEVSEHQTAKAANQFTTRAVTIKVDGMFCG
jgi:P-type Cu+ transporter